MYVYSPGTGTECVPARGERLIRLSATTACQQPVYSFPQWKRPRLLYFHIISRPSLTTLSVCRRRQATFELRCSRRGISYIVIPTCSHPVVSIELLIYGRRADEIWKRNGEALPPSLSPLSLPRSLPPSLSKVAFRWASQQGTGRHSRKCSWVLGCVTFWYTTGDRGVWCSGGVPRLTLKEMGLIPEIYALVVSTPEHLELQPIIGIYIYWLLLRIYKCLLNDSSSGTI